MFTRTVSAAVNQVNSDMTVRFTTMADQLDAALTREKLLAMLTGFFGVLGVLLAAIGLFGVTSYAVSLRRAELSVRLALGASAERIMYLVFKRMALLVGAGVVCGTVLTWWLAQFVNATLLYGVQPRDLPTNVGAAFLLIAIALFAGWWPARRATRFDPAPLLRET
jgi:ABC-type antimicrobial peptide transport system permease subunit